jgi:TolA-binding protein
MAIIDETREKLIQSNGARLEAYDAAMARVREVQSENEHLHHQVNELNERVRQRDGTISQQNTLIDDLQSREQKLSTQNELYLQSRQTILTNLESAVDAIDGAHITLKHTLENALSNARNSISHEITDREQAPLRNRTLERLNNVLNGGHDADHVDTTSPPLVPDAAAAEVEKIGEQYLTDRQRPLVRT